MMQTNKMEPTHTHHSTNHHTMKTHRGITHFSNDMDACYCCLLAALWSTAGYPGNLGYYLGRYFHAKGRMAEAEHLLRRGLVGPQPPDRCGLRPCGAALLAPTGAGQHGSMAGRGRNRRRRPAWLEGQSNRRRKDTYCQVSTLKRGQNAEVEHIAAEREHEQCTIHLAAGGWTRAVVVVAVAVIGE